MWTSLIALSIPLGGGKSATHSAVGPRKHQFASVDNDDPTFREMFENDP